MTVVSMQELKKAIETFTVVSVVSKRELKKAIENSAQLLSESQ